MLLFAGCQSFTAALNSLHYCIRSRAEVNFVDVCGYDTRRAGLPGIAAGSFAGTVFTKTSSIQSMYPYFWSCTRIQYVALAIILPNSGEWMHRDRIPPQRMPAAYRIVTRGSCCTKRFAEFNGNCESFCSLEQLVASLCAADEGKSASVRIIRRQKAAT